jgi:hypothetical protein
MPMFLNKGQKQFSTKQSNESRLCTKIRWVVEATNSLLKQKFRALDSTIQNKSLSHYLVDFRIAGALINRYSSRISSDTANSDALANRMFTERHRDNQLQEIVERYGLHRKSQFKDIEFSELDDFPKLSLNALINHIAFGSFQLKFGPSYISEFIKKHGSFRLCCCKDLYHQDPTTKIITTKVQSRHSNNKSYRVYVQYQQKNEDSSTENSKSINGWYCECKNGSRTLGFCCHIGSIIFFLAYGRYETQQKAPAENLNVIFPAFGCDESSLTDTQTQTQITQTQVTQTQRTQPIIRNERNLKKKGLYNF